MREEKTTWWLAAKRCDVHNRACPDIAHYNFSATLQVVGSPEGLGVAPSHLGRCPKNPARAVCLVQPDQRVTLSLGTPLRGFHP